MVLGSLVVIASVSVAQDASAQRAQQQVLDLNRQAMEHYTNLEFDEAQAKLRQALQIAQRGNVGGMPLARTYMNLGVVSVGLQDNAAAMEAFQSALQIDSNIRLDPLTSSPDVSTVFNMARRTAGTGPGPDPDPDPDPGPGPSSAPGNIPHEPVQEQLQQTAIPVWVEVPDDAPVGSIQLFFKGTGMREFRRVMMERLPGGFGYEIPCADVFQPSVEYYLVAFGSDDEPMGYAGTAEEPISIPIVTSRSAAAPALPGRAPPEQCTDAECPPGMNCASQGSQTCLSSAECPLGQECVDNFCVGGDDDDDDDDDSSGGDPWRFFFHVGGFWGSAYVSSGMPADGAPLGGDENVFVREGDGDCADNGDDFDDFCVRIETAGFVPTFGLRLAVGYYFYDRFGAAAFFRYQPNSGEGTLSSILFGGRLQFLITEPATDGFNAAAYLGTSFGQIQPQPSQNGEEVEPFVRSGLNGIQIGGIFGYRFLRYFGIFAEPEIMFQLPLFLMNIELIVGLDAGF
jgi:hypothetical protein